MAIIGGSIGTARGNAEAPFRPLLRLDTDATLEGLKRMAETVHAHGVPIIAEVMTAFGRMGVPRLARDLISASPINVVIPEGNFPRGLVVPGGRTTAMPREATISEIEAYEKETISSALRVQRAGWDGAEVAANMSYFAASFLSPRTNWRTDRYGGSVENRARFLVNVVSRLREQAGEDFVIGLRMPANEHLPDSQDAETYAQIARLVQDAGADYVALADGCYERMDVGTPQEDGLILESGSAQAFKKALDIPLILQGFHDPRKAARAIADGHGDAVMLARSLLADPEYPAKVLAGELASINHCTREHLCLRRLVMNMPVRCAVNPQAGREARGSSWPSPSRIFRGVIERVVLAITSSPVAAPVARAVIKFRKSGSTS